MSQKYVVSIPKKELHDLTEGKNYIADIQLSNLRLSVSPFNARLISTWNTMVLIIPLPIDFGYPEAMRFGRHDQSAIPPFIIEITIEVQHDDYYDYSINPSLVALNVQGKDYQPDGMIFPKDLRFSLKPFQAISRCHMQNHLKSASQFSPLQQIHLATGEKTCLWLSFNVAPPVPESNFSLSIEGIQRNGLLVKVPSITFHQGISYQNESIP